MADFNPRDIATIPGKLCVDPTDLAAAYPHGGIGLGVVRNIEFSSEIKYSPVMAEEFGEVVESIATAQGCILTATLQSWDPEALRNIFWNTEEGTTTARRKVKEPGTVRAGHLLSSRSKVLLFSPNDTDRDPMLIIRRAMPYPVDSARASLRLDSDVALAFGWLGIRDTSGRLYEWGMRKDITL